MRIFDHNLPTVNALNQALGGREYENIHDIFFKPDDDFIDWLIEYARERLILEVGSGSGHLLRLLQRKYKMLMGIEPYFDLAIYTQTCVSRGIPLIHMYPREIENSGHLVSGLGERAMIVLARPSHAGMVEATLEVAGPGQEVLYITKPENLELYNDLGSYRSLAKKISHKGKGSEGEEVWSIIKE